MFRNVVKSIAKNTSVMLLQYAATMASTFLLMLFLPRYLGPIEFGKLYLAISFIEIFRIFVSYGGSYLVAKDVSRSHESTPQILVDAIWVRLVFAVLSLVAIALIPLFLGYTDSVRILLMVYGLALLWQAGTTALYACYQGREIMAYNSVGVVTERAFSAVVGVLAVILGAKSFGIAVVFVIGTLLNFLVLAGFAKKIVPFLPRVNWKDALRQVREGLPYFLFAVFSSLYYRIDAIMLSKMTPETVVGWYGGAHRLFEALNAVPYILSVALYHILARLWKEDMEIHRQTTRKSLEYVVVCGVVIIVGGIAFARDVIGFFYGLSGYGPSIPVFQVLALGLAFLCVDMVLGTCLLASDKQKQLSIISFVAIPINMFLNFLLIPYFQARDGNGAIGSAAATGVTEIFIMISALRLIPKGILEDFRFSVAIKSISAGVIMAGSILVMDQFGMPFFGKIVLSAGVYIASLLLMRTFEPQEQEFFMNLFGFQRLKRLTQSFLPEWKSYPQHH